MKFLQRFLSDARPIHVAAHTHLLAKKVEKVKAIMGVR